MKHTQTLCLQLYFSLKFNRFLHIHSGFDIFFSLPNMYSVQNKKNSIKTLHIITEQKNTHIK